MVSGGTRGWGDWEPFDGSPYVDWDDQLGGLSAFTCGAGLAGPPVAPDPAEGGAAGADAGGTRLEQLDRFYSGLMQEMLRALSATPYRMPPFPPDAAYCDDPRPLRAYFDKVRADGTLPEALRGAPLDPAFHMGPTDAIIGVIDLGIGLGQRRTRRRDTTNTRILAAWQQSAPRGAGGQAYLPFGREMLADDINAAIGAHTHGDRFDEDTFNRFTGVEDYRRPLGQREAGLLAPHGPHILDCAAGYDPDHDYPAPDGQAGAAYDPVEQRRIIAVNLPARELVGHAAQYLEFFAIFGLLRIAILSDALWEANAPRWTTASNDPSAADGFDIVVNLSFGKQASARDGSDLLTRTLARINAVRQSHNLKPIYLSMPAGNENLDRGNARTTLGAGATQDVALRILPEDQSANFAEVWADYPTGAQIGDAPVLDVSVDTPTGDALAPVGSTTRQVRYLRDADGTALAALYAMGVQEPNADRRRIGYVLATRWTQMYAQHGIGRTAPSLAPAGLWPLGLHNRGSAAITLVANVQSDQTEKPQSVTNQRSYFDHADYTRIDAAGRTVDTYSYPRDGSAPEPRDTGGFVRRHGTLNAVGKNAWTLLAAAHRASDGRMEGYSASGIKSLAANEGTLIPGLPTASMPSRDSGGVHGYLAAGGRDGAAVALQGTSVAAAMMARRFMDYLTHPPADAGAAADKVEGFMALAAAEEAATPHPGQVVDVKAGHGRMGLRQTGEALGRFGRLGR